MAAFSIIYLLLIASLASAATNDWLQLIEQALAEARPASGPQPATDLSALPLQATAPTPGASSSKAPLPFVMLVAPTSSVSPQQQQQLPQRQYPHEPAGADGATPERKRRMSNLMHAPLLGPPQPTFNALDQLYAMDALLLDNGTGPLGRAYKPKTISTARGFGKRANGW